MKGIGARISHRLALMVLICAGLSALPTTMLLKKIGDDVTFFSREVRGVESARAVLRILQNVQLHRGLSSAVLSGAESLDETRRARAQQVVWSIAAFKPLMPADESQDAAKVRDALARIETQWAPLPDAVGTRQLSAMRSLRVHTDLAATVLELLDAVLDHSWLTFDPEAKGYFLMFANYVQLPWLSENLGRSRALGAALLSARQGDALQRANLASMLDRVEERMLIVRPAIRKIFETNADIKERFGAEMQEMEDRIEKAVDIARRDVVASPELKLPPAEYIATFTQAIDAQFKLSNGLSLELDRVLTERIAKRNADWWLAIGGALVMLLTAFGLSGWIGRSITKPLDRAVSVASAIAKGKLANTVQASGTQEAVKLLDALADMQARLVSVVGRMQAASVAIHEASTQIAAGHEDLSSRTEEQASSLEETAANMEELTATVHDNSENADSAAALARVAETKATKGGQVVAEVASSMDAIRERSRRITEVTEVIDSIAFQTNILALNAAVEAARAGEHGRGFAVVAGEVRGLAARCAQSAKEIKGLIAASVESIETGSGRAEAAGAAMQEIVQSVQQVADMMGRIAAASAQQTSGIEQMNQAITQMESMTQQNAALVEQAAATSLAFKAQARELGQTAMSFDLGGGAISRPVEDGTTTRDDAKPRIPAARRAPALART